MERDERLAQPRRRWGAAGGTGDHTCRVRPEAKLIVNLTRGGVVCERAVIADRALRRMRGLLGRRTLPEGEGILLRPAPSIHTAFMRFPIDAVFLAKDLEVLKVVAGLRPWRAASASGGRAARPRMQGHCQPGSGEPERARAARSR